MYVKRIQLLNYGPIDHLDISFPFQSDAPKPVLLVGENGSGKSVLLSHIVNGLVLAKTVAYPDSPEVEPGKVYKLRSSSYIKSGADFYAARVDFDGAFFVSELRALLKKQDYPTIPSGIEGTAAEAIWATMNLQQNDHYESNLNRDPSTSITVRDIFAKNCALYFPFNRFEEPAWLNEDNLTAQAEYTNLKHIVGYTTRRVIASSPLREIQNWLFDVLYDRAVFEIQTPRINLPLNNTDDTTTFPLPFFAGYSGHAARIYETALQIVRVITKREDARFGIGRRDNRVVSLQSDVTGQIVANIFQLSSGETSLLNLFLSIVRDFDLCGAPLSNTADIQGIVMIDEIDLHLHAVHQYEVLPELIKMFPSVQFVATTHSPLFVLGMQRVLGEDGFALYRLPEGRQISPEEFSEFGDAYQAFAETVRFSTDIHLAIEGAQKPVVYVEGSTGQKYIHRAAQLLGHQALLERADVRDGGGAGDLRKIWKTWLPDLIPQKVMLLFDCEEQVGPDEKGNLLRRSIPLQSNNPIEKGIENLFGKETLERARHDKSAYIDVEHERTRTVRGESQCLPEKWTVNPDEKTNLCDWLCENGTAEDFEGFQVIFDLLEGPLDLY